MIISMTGYATCTSNLKSYSLTCKIKTLNHRYLDYEIYLPVNDLELESEIADLIKQNLDRGKILVSFELNSNTVESDFQLDKPLLKKYKKVLEQAGNLIKDKDHLNIIFNHNYFSDLIKTTPIDEKNLKQEIKLLFNRALKKLLNTRKNEGKELEKDIKTRLNDMKLNLKNIRKHKKDHIKGMEKIFKEKLKKFNEDISSRAMDIIDFELGIIAEKADITEEIVRANYHIKSFLKSLASGDRVSGKKLEFISQELLREFNTIASKSASVQIRSNVILIKEQIEKIRQQLRNVE